MCYVDGMPFIKVAEYQVTGFDALREGQRVMVSTSVGKIVGLQWSDKNVKVDFGDDWGWYPCDEVSVWRDA